MTVTAAPASTTAKPLMRRTQARRLGDHPEDASPRWRQRARLVLALLGLAVPPALVLALSSAPLWVAALAWAIPTAAWVLVQARSRRLSENAQLAAAQALRHALELQRSEQRFDRAFSHAAIGMALVAADGVIVKANAALATLLGVAPGSVTGIPFAVHVAEPDLRSLLQAMQAVRDGLERSFGQQLRCRRPCGELLHVAVDGSHFDDDDGGRPRLIVQLQDVSARVLAEQRLQHIAFHDGLTQLPNRVRFLAELDEAMRLARELPTRRCAVMFLDFDRFKLINDSLGHNVGDRFLQEVATRLSACISEHNLVARLGGDEFSILLRDVAVAADVEMLAIRVQASIRKPMLIDGHELHTSASIGIRLSDPSTQTPQDMLRDADTAMYRAKAAGKARHCLFDAGMHAEAMAELELEKELRQALTYGGLDIALQPIVDAATGHVTAYEAFARWQHPRLGWLSADRFIRLAEECGLIRPLSQCVLELSCAAIQQLRVATGRQQTLHVNVSTLDLCQSGFAARLAELLLRTGMPPHELWLEITERSLSGHLDAIAQTLCDLRELGVGLCLDDFGTGNSALRHLSALPLQRLKVDGSLLHDVDAVGQGRGAEILRAVIQLGHSLGMSVVAEGVESERQWMLARELGCSYAQGYLFGQPESVDVWVDRVGASDTLGSLGPATVFGLTGTALSQRRGAVTSEA